MENATLAPASGSGIGKLLADALLAHPDFLALMTEAAIGGLSATRSFFVKTGAREGHMETEADYRTRTQTLALLLAHMEGEPIKRIIHQHVGEGKAIDPVKAMQASPELRESVRRTLEKAEFRTRHTKKAEPTGEPLTLDVE